MKNYTGWKCGLHGVEERCIQAFDGEKLRESGHLHDLDVDGRLILNLVFKN
jgi:hypothetical protein